MIINSQQQCAGFQLGGKHVSIYTRLASSGRNLSKAPQDLWRGEKQVSTISPEAKTV